MFKLGKVALIGSADHHDGLAPTSGIPAKNIFVSFLQRNGESELAKKKEAKKVTSWLYWLWKKGFIFVQWLMKGKIAMHVYDHN